MVCSMICSTVCSMGLLSMICSVGCCMGCSMVCSMVCSMGCSMVYPVERRDFFYCIPLSQIIPPAKAQKKIQCVTFVVAQLSNPLARKSHPALESVALASKLNKKLWRKRCRQLFSSNLTCATGERKIRSSICNSFTLFWNAYLITRVSLINL